MFSSKVMHGDFALILILLGTAVPLLGRRRIGQLMRMPETTPRDRLTLYASTILFQWSAGAAVLWRSSAHGISFVDLGLAVPSLARTAAVTILVSVLVFANQTLSLRDLKRRPEAARGILPQLGLKIFPQDLPERLVFFALVLTVAVCEELIYRGFVQRVFQDWSGGVIVAGIFGSAALFGIAHLYQGGRGLIATFVVGILFSTVRWWTGSLVPAVVAHFVADLMAGFLTPPRLREALADLAVQSRTAAAQE